MPAEKRSARRVLFLSHSAGLGGAERILTLVVCGLDRRRYHPVVVVPEEGPLKRELERCGVETEVSDVRWWGGWPGGAGATHRRFTEGLSDRVRSMTRIIEHHRIEIAVTNTCVVAELALAAKECGIPHVWYVHEMLSQDPGLAALLQLKTLYALMLSLSARVVVVSNAVKRELAQFVDTDEKVSVLHSGMPVPQGASFSKESLLGLDESARVVTFVGLLCERKGVQILADVAPLVLSAMPSAHFVLVGADTDVASGMTATVRARGVAHAFSFLGARPDALEIIRVSDVLVLPSLSDPLPCVIMEAMALSIPVVATRSGGAEEMVVDGETGHLVPVNDAPAIANAILEILASSTLREKMARNAKNRSDELFVYEVFVRNFEALLDATTARSIPDPGGMASAMLLESIASPSPLADHIRNSLAFRGLETFWDVRDRIVRPGTKLHAEYGHAADRMRNIFTWFSTATRRLFLRK